MYLECDGVRLEVKSLLREQNREGYFAFLSREIEGDLKREDRFGENRVLEVEWFIEFERFLESQQLREQKITVEGEGC